MEKLQLILEQDLGKIIVAIIILFIILTIVIIIVNFSSKKKTRDIERTRKIHREEFEKAGARREMLTQTISRSDIVRESNRNANVKANSKENTMTIVPPGKRSSVEKTQELNMAAIRKKQELEDRKGITPKKSNEDTLKLEKKIIEDKKDVKDKKPEVKVEPVPVKVEPVVESKESQYEEYETINKEIVPEITPTVEVVKKVEPVASVVNEVEPVVNEVKPVVPVVPVVERKEVQPENTVAVDSKFEDDFDFDNKLGNLSGFDDSLDFQPSEELFDKMDVLLEPQKKPELDLGYNNMSTFNNSDEYEDFDTSVDLVDPLDAGMEFEDFGSSVGFDSNFDDDLSFDEYGLNDGLSDPLSDDLEFEDFTPGPGYLEPTLDDLEFEDYIANRDLINSLSDNNYDDLTDNIFESDERKSELLGEHLHGYSEDPLLNANILSDSTYDLEHDFEMESDMYLSSDSFDFDDNVVEGPGYDEELDHLPTMLEQDFILEIEPDRLFDFGINDNVEDDSNTLIEESYNELKFGVNDNKEDFVTESDKDSVEKHIADEMISLRYGIEDDLDLDYGNDKNKNDTFVNDISNNIDEQASDMIIETLFDFGVNDAVDAIIRDGENHDGPPKNENIFENVDFGQVYREDSDMDNDDSNSDLENIVFSNIHDIGLNDIIDASTSKVNVVNDKLYFNNMDLDIVVIPNDVETEDEPNEEKEQEDGIEIMHENNEKNVVVNETPSENHVINITKPLDVIDSNNIELSDEYAFADDDYNYNYNFISIMDEIIDDIEIDEIEDVEKQSDGYFQYLYQFAMLDDIIDSSTTEPIFDLVDTNICDDEVFEEKKISVENDEKFDSSLFEMFESVEAEDNISEIINDLNEINLNQELLDLSSIALGISDKEVLDDEVPVIENKKVIENVVKDVAEDAVEETVENVDRNKQSYNAVYKEKTVYSPVYGSGATKQVKGEDNVVNKKVVENSVQDKKPVNIDDSYTLINTDDVEITTDMLARSEEDNVKVEISRASTGNQRVVDDEVRPKKEVVEEKVDDSVSTFIDEMLTKIDSEEEKSENNILDVLKEITK